MAPKTRSNCRQWLVNQWLKNGVLKTPDFYNKRLSKAHRSFCFYLFSVLFIYFDCVTYSLKVALRKNRGHVTPLPPHNRHLYNDHFPLSPRWPLWRREVQLQKLQLGVTIKNTHNFWRSELKRKTDTNIVTKVIKDFENKNRLHNQPAERTWSPRFPVWTGSTGEQTSSRTPHRRKQAQLKTK